MASDAASEESDKSSRPIPDPTVLTTSQLLREISSLKELIESEIHATSEVTYEKFRSIENRMNLVEAQRVEQKADTKAAVDAALTAQKEAVREQTLASERAIAKSEAATTKQLDQIATTFQTAIGAASDTISDVKERVGRIENIKTGGQEVVVDRRQQNTLVIAVAAVIVSALLLVGAVTTILLSKP